MTESRGNSVSRASSILYFLFFLSGFAGLVYEVLWTRRFGLSFGNTTLAATVVLSAFMGGLALGSRFLGVLADRWRERVSTLTLYGWMEIGIGVYCLAFERLVAAQDSLLLMIYRSFDPGPGASLALKLTLALLILIVPSTLMGGTLPVLIKQLSRKLTQVGAVTGRLYFVNCLGAVGGALAVAFWMIPQLGMALSNASAAAINILVGVGALALRSRWEQTEQDENAQAPEPDFFAVSEPRRVMRWALIGIFISGFTAMLYQVAWIRLLSLVLGSSTYSFSLMVAAFISGIALGSLIISRLMPRIQSPARVFALCQAGIALTVLAMLPIYSRLPLFFVAGREAVDFGYRGHEVFKYVVSLAVMLGPTTLFGMGFPLVSRMAAASREHLAGRVGGVYALNTAGNILGAGLAGLALIPLVGMKITIEGAVLLNMGSAAAILFALGPQWRRPALRVVLVSVAGLFLYYLLAPSWDRHLLTAGRLPLPRWVRRPRPVWRQAATGKCFITGRARPGVVSVERHDSLLTLRVNGKSDASTGLDMPTQLLLAHLPMLLHPDPSRVLVIGAGSGVTCGGALSHPELKGLDCVEISPEVLEASRQFAAWNRRYWADPRVRLMVDDGRNYIFRTEKQFDIITSEPSNPWIAGIGNLYTSEFYRSCLGRLAPGGILCQWIHLYEMEESVLKTILRTLLESFPHAVAFSSVENSDLLLICPTTALAPDFAELARRMEQPEVIADLRHIGLERPFALLTTQVFDNKGLRSWAGIGPLNTDNFPLVEYEAPRGFYNAASVTLPDENRLRGGRTLLRQWLEEHSPTVEDYLALARYQGRSGYNVLMYSALVDALQLEPENIEALSLMVGLLTSRMKYAEALTMLDRLAATGVSETRILNAAFPVHLALDRRSAGSFVRGADYARSMRTKIRLIELEPQRSLHLFDLADLYYRDGDYSQAEETFGRALELRSADRDPAAPDRAVIIQYAARTALEGRRYEQAILWYGRYCAEFPGDPLGPQLLRLAAMERLVDQGGTVTADSLRRVLGD